MKRKAEESAVVRMMLAVARLIPDRVAIPYRSKDVQWMLFRREAEAT